MPNAGFDNSIFAPAPLPTSGSVAPPSSGSGREFDDLLQRAGQPASRTTEDQTNSDLSAYDREVNDSADRQSYLPSPSARQPEPRNDPPPQRTRNDGTNQDNSPSKSTRTSGKQRGVKHSDARKDRDSTAGATKQNDRSPKSDDSSDSSTDAAVAGSNSDSSSANSDAKQVVATQVVPTVTDDASANSETVAKTAGQVAISVQNVADATAETSGNESAQPSAATSTTFVTATADSVGQSAGVPQNQTVIAAQIEAATKPSDAQAKALAASKQPEINLATQQSTEDGQSSALSPNSIAPGELAAGGEAANAQATSAELEKTVSRPHPSRIDDKDADQNDNTTVDLTATYLAAVVPDFAGTLVSATLPAAQTTDKATDAKPKADDKIISPADAAANKPAALPGENSTDVVRPVAANQPAQLSTDGRNRGPDATGPARGGQNSVDQVRFVQRVARAFRAADEQGGEVRLRLSPPELGALKVEIAVRNGVLSARLEAETASARNLLLDNLPALRERLAEQNIKIERFDVDLKQNGTGGGSGNSSPDFADPRGALPTPSAANRNRNGVKTDGEAIQPMTTSRASDGRINIIV